MKPLLAFFTLSITVIAIVASRPVPSTTIPPVYVAGQATGVLDPFALISFAGYLACFGLMGSLLTTWWHNWNMKRMMTEVVKQGFQEWREMEREKSARERVVARSS
jgi:hypothetical protein